MKTLEHGLNVPPSSSNRRSSRLAGKEATPGLPNYLRQDGKELYEWKSIADSRKQSLIPDQPALLTPPNAAVQIPVVLSDSDSAAEESKHNTDESPQPEQHHSAKKAWSPHKCGPHFDSSPSPMSSSDDEEGLDDSNISWKGMQYLHNYRDPGFKSDFENTQRQKPKLPPLSDKKQWNELDLELSTVLDEVFSKNKVQSIPSNRFADHFDTLIWEFFKNHCGLEEPPSNLPPPILGPPKHKGLESLRRKKQSLRKAIKALRSSGCAEDSAPLVALKDTWVRLLKVHNRLRRAVKEKQKARAKKFAKRRFNKDRNAFAKKLFSGQRKCGSPTFPKETAESYFAGMYHDRNRSDDFTPLEGMVRPELPKHAFDIRPPTLSELRRGMKQKRNGAAPGLNGLSYVIYKKCPSILRTLHRIFRQIYKTKDIPESWASAFVVLLQKSDDLSLPEEFRPIAITNTVGKLFFSIIASRTQKFMVKNKFIKTGTQKGFLNGVPGCIEHPFALHEALRTAKEETRVIVTSWIDLANAYGSIRHNLIQFALEWYHVPLSIQKLIFDYYEKLCAKITTKEWSTKFFSFDIGLFQGCVLSTILFDCVFNLLLDFLASFEKKHAFTIVKPSPDSPESPALTPLPKPMLMTCLSRPTRSRATKLS